jgi:hypothetical protein
MVVSWALPTLPGLVVHQIVRRPTDALYLLDRKRYNYQIYYRSRLLVKIFVRIIIRLCFMQSHHTDH